jgi:hypothetical protein
MWPSDPQMAEIRWDIRREGRSWTGDEAMSRYKLAPEKIELIRGKLFWNDEQRLRMLALLLEQMGADAAVRLGDPEVWRDAVAEL